MQHSNDITIPHRPFRVGYSKLTPVESTKGDVLSVECVYKETSNAESISKFRSADFSLGNLIAIGAFGGLSYVSMSLNSDMNFVDEFAKTFAENVTTNN